MIIKPKKILRSGDFTFKLKLIENFLAVRYKNYFTQIFIKVF